MQSAVQQVRNEPKKGLACNNCQQPHPMYRCAKFLALNLQERKNRVRELNLCTNCFSTNHKSNSLSCKSGPCKRCNKGPHNSLLCHTAVASTNAIAVGNWQQPAGQEVNAPNSGALVTYQPQNNMPAQSYHVNGNSNGTNFR